MNLTIDISQNHFKAVFPESSFVTATTITLAYGVMYNPSAVHRFPILTKVIGWLAAQTLTLALMLTVNGWNTAGSAATNVPTSNNVPTLDDPTLIVKCVILLSALSSIFISFDYIKGQKINSFEYIIPILLPTLSMLFIVSPHDPVGMYLAIESQSPPLHVPAAFQRNNEFSAEAGLKYFTSGAPSSGLLLFGESIPYGLTGITNFEELTKLFTFFSGTSFALEESGVYLENQGLVVNAIAMGLLFMLVASLPKISAVPFHMWAPDVYEGAPTSVTAFFAITPKIAILSLLLRLCLYTCYDSIDSWQQIIIICSFLSMFIGTLGATNQKKIKRLLAYSSIAHVGYLLIGLATGTIEAVESLSAYIVVYVSMVICSSGIILSLSKENYHSFDLMPSFISSTRTTLGSTDASFQNNRTSLNVNSALVPSISSLPTDYANPAYSTGPNSSFVYMLRSGLQLATSLRTLDTVSTQSGPANWEPNYLKAGQPLWDPYGPLSFGSSPVNSFDSHRLCPISSETPAPSIKKKDEFVKSITDLSSLSKANPTMAVTFAIVLFSNAGIPPLAGSSGKPNVSSAAVEGSTYFSAISGILCSAMGAFHSIRSIKIIHLHKINQRTWQKYKPISKESSFILGLTFFFTSFSFPYPSFPFITTHSAALSLRPQLLSLSSVCLAASTFLRLFKLSGSRRPLPLSNALSFLSTHFVPFQLSFFLNIHLFCYFLLSFLCSIHEILEKPKYFNQKGFLWTF